MTLEGILPGSYEMYITVQDAADPMAVFPPGISVEIYMGSGKPGEMKKADVIQLPDTSVGDKWVYLGKFLATADECTPNPTAFYWQASQIGQGSDICVAWFNAGSQSAGWEEYLFELTNVKDASNNEEITIAKYSLDGAFPQRVKGTIHKVKLGMHTLSVEAESYIPLRMNMSLVDGFLPACTQNPAVTLMAEKCTSHHFIQKKGVFLVPDDGLLNFRYFS